jgi:glycosyltransferase involved in cell wall biosynthesis
VNSPLVSVVIPVFNRTSYIGFAISSVLKQTFQDFEIIVVDDGSKNEDEICLALSKFDDSRIKYIRKANGGVASAINYGIRRMRGSYFCWLSDDDLFHPLHLAIGVKYLLTQNTPTIHFSNWSFIDSQGDLMYVANASQQLDYLVTDLGPIERGLISAISTMIPISVFEAIGTFDERLKYTQDYDFFLRAAISGIAWNFSSYVAASIRLHDGQMTHFKDSNVEEDEFWSRVASTGADQILVKYREAEIKNRLISFRDSLQLGEHFAGVTCLDDVLKSRYRDDR